jgi:hypothetical protein
VQISGIPRIAGSISQQVKLSFLAVVKGCKVQHSCELISAYRVDCRILCTRCCERRKYLSLDGRRAGEQSRKPLEYCRRDRSTVSKGGGQDAASWTQNSWKRGKRYELTMSSEDSLISELRPAEQTEL